MIKEIDEQSILFGKGQFKQLYFPIKRIHFDSNTKYSKIYENTTRSLTNVKKQGRIMRFAYHIPFLTYYINYLFFLSPDQIMHTVALASLLIGANAKSLNDSLKIQREIAELYISADAQEFIAVLPKTIISNNINELQGKLKNSMFAQNECQGFSFNLNDIESISLLSNDHSKIKQEVLDKDKVGTKKTNSDSVKINQAEQKQQILEKLSKIQENDETLIITISKNEWKYSRTFRLNLQNNQLSQFNDYMIALGYKQRIVMRESMIPNTSSKNNHESKNNQNQENNNAKSNNQNQKISTSN